MKHFTKAALTLFTMSLLFAFTGLVNAQVKSSAEKLLEPFPKAAEGMVRHVIILPKKADESMYKVELIPGKVMSVDCNHHNLMGKLSEKNLEGWGYTYYEFLSDGQTASTMMACHKPNENKFISGETMLIRYNSKLPIVFFAPKGFEVKYRIWKADKTRVALEK